MSLAKYHTTNEDEFEEVVIEPVTPIKQPAMWTGVYTQRNLDALELVIQGLHKFGADQLAQEMQLILVQGSLMRPTT